MADSISKSCSAAFQRDLENAGTIRRNGWALVGAATDELQQARYELNSANDRFDRSLPPFSVTRPLVALGLQAPPDKVAALTQRIQHLESRMPAYAELGARGRSAESEIRARKSPAPGVECDIAKPVAPFTDAQVEEQLK